MLWRSAPCYTPALDAFLFYVPSTHACAFPRHRLFPFQSAQDSVTSGPPRDCEAKAEGVLNLDEQAKEEGLAQGALSSD